MAYYESPYDYLQTATTVKEEMRMIQDIISALRASMLSGAGKVNIEEYQVNSGQSIIKAIYRSPSEIYSVIKQLKQDYNDMKSQLEGRMGRNVDSRNAI